MPDKALRIRRAGGQAPARRPVMLAIAGDSAAGKTTMTRGLVEALGPERCVSLCTDDYHRYDREERKELPFTALHPDGNYLEIMEQHLQLLATGAPVLKPVDEHGTGRLVRPELVEPPESSLSSRACSRCTAAWRGRASTSPSSWTRPRRCAAGGRCSATRASAATPRTWSSPSWSAGSRSRRPTSARSGRRPTIAVEKAIWSAFGAPDTETPACLGQLGDARSEPLAIAQLLLLDHLTDAAR